jgi:hypothetical protein
MYVHLYVWKCSLFCINQRPILFSTDLKTECDCQGHIYMDYMRNHMLQTHLPTLSATKPMHIS